MDVSDSVCKIDSVYKGTCNPKDLHILKLRTQIDSFSALLINLYEFLHIDKLYYLFPTNVLRFTLRLTPESGLSSDAAATNSFPYLETNSIWTCCSSVKSEHLGAAKHTLDIASFRSSGHSLQNLKTRWIQNLSNNDRTEDSETDKRQ